MLLQLATAQRPAACRAHAVAPGCGGCEVVGCAEAAEGLACCVVRQQLALLNREVLCVLGGSSAGAHQSVLLALVLAVLHEHLNKHAFNLFLLVARSAQPLLHFSEVQLSSTVAAESVMRIAQVRGVLLAAVPHAQHRTGATRTSVEDVRRLSGIQSKRSCRRAQVQLEAGGPVAKRAACGDEPAHIERRERRLEQHAPLQLHGRIGRGGG